MGLRLSDLSPVMRKRLGLEAKVQRSKYGAVKQTIDGEKFDSTKEARRYQELRILERARQIQNLQLQPRYYITRDGVRIGSYRADFRYQLWGSRDWIVEDAKGGKATKTEAYRLRKKLVEAQYQITIHEV